MFQFFRHEKPNFDYWHEKLEAVDAVAGAKAFDREGTLQVAQEVFLEWARENSYDCTKEERREAWRELRDHGHSDRHHSEIVANMIWLKAGRHYPLEDAWEVLPVMKYTHRFKWACRAIIHAIKLYDARIREFEKLNK
jgi:hypothetical protein